MSHCGTVKPSLEKLRGDRIRPMRRHSDQRPPIAICFVRTPQGPADVEVARLALGGLKAPMGEPAVPPRKGLVDTSSRQPGEMLLRVSSAMPLGMTQSDLALSVSWIVSYPRINDACWESGNASEKTSRSGPQAQPPLRHSTPRRPSLAKCVCFDEAGISGTTM